MGSGKMGTHCAVDSLDALRKKLQADSVEI